VSGESVAAGQRLAYAAPAFALAFVGIPIYVYLPNFYTDVVGVDVVVLGAVILAARLFDAFTDPLTGYLSDRTRTRFGRRRPYIAIGAVPLAASVLFLLSPPDVDPLTATIWFSSWLFLTFLFWTVIVVPYESLGPEITLDYDERTAVLGLRDGLLILGTLAAASSPALVSALIDLPEGAAGERQRFFWIGAFYAPILVVLCWWCVAAIRERPLTSRRDHGGALADLSPLFENRPFLILLASYMVSAFGSNLPATMLLYYVEYVLESGSAELFLVEYLVTGVVFLPLWIALSARVGKRRAWIASMLVNTGAFIGVFFLGPGDVVAFGALVFLSGIGMGATLAIPSSMQADVIDYDALISGRRREGRYVGLWSIARKLVAALGVGLGLTILGSAGYVPNVPQTPAVLLTLRILYALVPSICNLVAICIALFYPIDRERQEAILAAIEARNLGNVVEDPLRPGRRLPALA
jgi:GPH family glycoside/pentoside/hexuronide:cation symporter